MDMKRIRILHTADLRLDASFAALGGGAALGNQLRMAQLAVFGRIIDRAKAWPADVVCISGGLFAGLRVSRTVMDYVLSALEQLAPARVYIAPGGCDPFTPDSPYALELWPDNVTLFAPDAWQAVAHDTLPLTIHGLSADGRQEGRMLPSFETPGDGRIHIAVVPGVEQGSPAAGKNALPVFRTADIALDGVAYLALGGLPGEVEVTTGGKTVARYPGAPQGLGYDECASRYVLQVEISYEDDPGGAVVAVSSLDVADVLFEEISLEADQAADAAACFDALRGTDRRERVVRVRLEGERPLFASEVLAMIREEGKQRFLHVELSDETFFCVDPFGAARNNTCLCKLADAMCGKINDESDRDAAVREAEALETALKACHVERLTIGQGLEAAE